MAIGRDYFRIKMLFYLFILLFIIYNFILKFILFGFIDYYFLFRILQQYPTSTTHFQSNYSKMFSHEPPRSPHQQPSDHQNQHQQPSDHQNQHHHHSDYQTQHHHLEHQHRYHRSNHHNHPSLNSSKSTEQTYHQSSQPTNPSHRQSIQLSEQDLHLNENYPEFHISSNNYDIVFVNNETTPNEFTLLLRHVRFCRQFSIDTESDQRNNKLSLIQINSMPVRDKSFVILIELEQLPHQYSVEYEKVRELFRFLFREDNEVYSWGDITKELEPRKDLFTWPIPAVLVNIQLHFPGWYSWGRSHCRETILTCLDNSDEGEDDKSLQQQRMLTCICHLQSPYNPKQLWSLKTAYKYGCKLSLDKSTTMGNWSSSLNSCHSSLSYEVQKKMVRYAVNDVMAVSFLARPIAEKWTFKQVESRSMKEALLGFNLVKFPQLSTPQSKKTKIKNLNVGTLSKIMLRLDPDLDSNCSDEEIYLEQIINQPPCDYQREDQDEFNNVEVDRLLPEENLVDVEVKMYEKDEEQMIVDNHEVVVNEVETPPVERRPSGKRSKQAKAKRNKRHNNRLRFKRYEYPLIRYYYYKVASKVARRILKQYKVPIRHIKKIKDNQYLIGVTSAEAQRQGEQALPSNCFDKHHYEQFRRRSH